MLCSGVPGGFAVRLGLIVPDRLLEYPDRKDTFQQALR